MHSSSQLLSLLTNIILATAALHPDLATAFVSNNNNPCRTATTITSRSLTFSSRQHRHLQSSASADDFAAFEASLVEEEVEQPKRSSSSSPTVKKSKTWQNDLEDFVDPSTPISERQTLLTNLLSANQDIRSSVESAILGRSIDPLLTPRGKRFQEGFRAVARQITSDILPELVQQNRNVVGNPAVSQRDLEKAGNRIFNALQNRFQTNMEMMQSDIQNDPLRSIPQRISKQSRGILKEASNVFSETPAGLKEPSHTVVLETADYEIRDYQAYRVATTNIVNAEDAEDNKGADLARNGAAFNTLAAYVFGANQEGLTIEMTTPITTTSSGEMRFYMDGYTPDPLKQDEGTNAYEKPGSILLQEIPPARLAVRRFAGFATKGEVTRQKQALLAALAMDSVELDVPHGATVPHVVFQYNPPYTLPVLRRNEIAVAVDATMN